MLAAKLIQPGEILVDHTTDAKCPEGGLLIEVAACGICASDVKMWRLGHKELVLPRILGHEVAGRIIESKAGHQAPPVGSLVQIAPGDPCGKCPACLSGHENRCPAIGVLGFSTDGGMARFMAVPAGIVRSGGVSLVPDGLDPATATLTEPLACGLNALEAARFEPGQRVAVFGAGVVGRLAMLAAAHCWAGRVLAIEADAARLEGLPFGGLHVAESLDPSAAMDLLGGPADVVIPATPSPEALDWAVQVLGPGGSLVLFSGLRQTHAIDLNQVHYKELALCGAFGCTAAQNNRAIDILDQNRKYASSLISRTLPLSEAVKGLEAAESKDTLKVVVKP